MAGTPKYIFYVNNILCCLHVFRQRTNSSVGVFEVSIVTQAKRGNLSSQLRVARSYLVAGWGIVGPSCEFLLLAISCARHDDIIWK